MPSDGGHVGDLGQGADLRAHRIADHLGARGDLAGGAFCKVGKAQAMA
jgi:hypothetical protein